ncbi:20S proteasome subunit beta 4 [Nematocida sp. AWRm77]|nr:20S proteasome subunit beta 4 [Nematocida sp. AWRm77]
MDALFGVAGEDFVVLASDASFRNNVVVSKTDHNRCTRVTNKIAVVSAGGQGDSVRAIKYVFETLKYEEMANGLKITEKAFSSVLQKHIHASLRKSPINTISIIGGVSEGKGQLMYVDQYGAVCSSKYIGTGYAAYMFHSSMDMKYTPGISEEEAVHLITEIYAGLKKRMVVNYNKLYMCIVNSNGITERLV